MYQQLDYQLHTDDGIFISDSTAGKTDLQVKLFVSWTLHKDYLKNHLLTYKWNQFSTTFVNELKKLQCKIIL